jgi:hypothetical protein
MAACEVCGNDHYLSFEVIAAGDRHTFDSFGFSAPSVGGHCSDFCENASQSGMDNECRCGHPACGE